MVFHTPAKPQCVKNDTTGENDELQAVRALGPKSGSAQEDERCSCQLQEMHKQTDWHQGWFSTGVPGSGNHTWQVRLQLRAAQEGGKVKRLIGVLFAVCLLLQAPGVFATQITAPTLANGSVVIEMFDHGTLQVIELSVTAKADGTVSDIVIPVNIDGLLYEVETDPGSTAPQDNYDLTLTSGGLDVMGGVLANRDTANTEREKPASGTVAINGNLTLTTTGNNVNAALFVVRIYYFQSK